MNVLRIHIFFRNSCSLYLDRLIQLGIVVLKNAATEYVCIICVSACIIPCMHVCIHVCAHTYICVCPLSSKKGLLVCLSALCVLFCVCSTCVSWSHYPESPASFIHWVVKNLCRFYFFE